MIPRADTPQGPGICFRPSFVSATTLRSGGVSTEPGSSPEAAASGLSGRQGARPEGNGGPDRRSLIATRDIANGNSLVQQ